MVSPHLLHKQDHNYVPSHDYFDSGCTNPSVRFHRINHKLLRSNFSHHLSRSKQLPKIIKTSEMAPLTPASSGEEDANEQDKPQDKAMDKR